LKKLTLSILLLIFSIAIVISSFLTREGSLITPVGNDTVSLDSGTFEAFPLPNYAKDQISDDYKSYFLEVEPGIKIHILEIGTGLPVFLQHGNPTSGFLYRQIVEALPLDKVRVIMPTLAGLGFSTKIPSHMHTLENHIRWINNALMLLRLEELIYAGQDWGGPIGMGALAKSPGLLKGAVVMNTGFNAPITDMDLSPIHAIVKTPIIGELITEVFVSIFDRLPQMQNEPNSIPTEIISLYGRPVTESGNKKAPLALMRMVSDGPEHPSSEQMRTIESYVRSLDIPIEIVWGMNDPILGKALPNMMNNFPNALVTRTEGGHFLQEEVPLIIADALVRVINEIETN